MTYPVVFDTVLNSLLMFPSTYLCEQGFLTLLKMKNKRRSRLNVEHDLRVCLSNTAPRIEKLICNKQAQPSQLISKVFETNTFVYILCNTILKMLIKLVVKIYSLNLASAYGGYTLIVFMTQGYLAAKRLRTTGLDNEKN